MVSVEGGKPRQGFQSRYADGEVDYFVGEDGGQTHNPDLHVHVIHRANGDVTMVITDRLDGTTKHSSPLELKSPDGNQVREAEKALAEVLRSLR